MGRINLALLALLVWAAPAAAQQQQPQQQYFGWQNGQVTTIDNGSTFSWGPQGMTMCDNGSCGQWGNGNWATEEGVPAMGIEPNGAPSPIFEGGGD